MILRFATASLLIAIFCLASGAARAQSVTTGSATTSGPIITTNPIRPSDTADPGIVRANGKWYAYHTSGFRHEGRFPIVVSDDLTSWTQIGYIFEPGNFPEWASRSWRWWAPEVHRVNDKYVAYYTTTEDGSRQFVVGAAVADKPEGPFKDIGAPLVRNEEIGLIDVNFFHDEKTNRNYIIWKEDRNDLEPQEPTPLVMQEVTTDGLKLVGKPREILRNDQPWEGVLVEAPSLIYHNGWYYLFYSGNIFSADEYSVGVARSRNVWGPYVKNPQPIMVHDDHFSGPAHQFIIKDEADVWHVFYHARLKSLEKSHRYLMHDLLKFDADGWPVINNGQPGPVSETMVEKVKELHEER